jgi:glycogen operon protein
MSAADIGPGRAHPIGARVDDGGVNFSVFAERASAVELLLFTRPDDPFRDRSRP